MTAARTYLGECAHYAAAERILRRASERVDEGVSFDEAVGLDEELRSYFDKDEFAIDTPEYAALVSSLAEVIAAETGDGYEPEQALEQNHRWRIARDRSFLSRPPLLPSRYVEGCVAANSEGWGERLRAAADRISQMPDAEMLTRTQRELTRQRAVAEIALEDLERDHKLKKERYEAERGRLQEQIGNIGETLSFVADDEEDPED